MSEMYAVGQRWRYRAPEGFEDSRIIVGAVLSFEEHQPIVCCLVTDAPQRTAEGGVERVTIPFLPMTAAAFAQTVDTLEDSCAVPEVFATHYAAWREDIRGMSYFTVPFEGLLDHMIARQMQQLIAA